MAIRQFKFTGSNEPGATAIITLKGVEVFNGALIGTQQNNSITAQGSIDIDNDLAVNNIITVPTSVIVLTGNMHVSLTKWDYGLIQNPVYTPEQFAILSTPGTPRSETVSIYEAVAVPPLSSADVTVLMSQDPVDATLQAEIRMQHNLNTYIQNASTFACGINPTTAACNRANVLLNGNTPPGADTNLGLFLVAGDVLTYDSLVFPTNWMPM